MLPFFEACASLDIAIAIHSAPGMNLTLPGADRFNNYRYFDIGSGVDWGRLQVVDPCVGVRAC